MTARGTQVVVHLGKIPSYVKHYTQLAAQALPEFDTILISDRAKLPAIRDVIVLPAQEFSRSESRAQIDSSLSRMGIDPNWRDGYWRKVFLRFDLVDAFMRRVDRGHIAIQLESDILSSLSLPIITEALEQRSSPCLMPFIDSQTGGPGLIIAKSPTGLSAVCAFVIDALKSGISASDMTALALARDSGFVTALPSDAQDSRLNLSITSEGLEHAARIVFDAAATGQYLFGVDARNNKGRIQPGYLETRGGLDPGVWTNWRVVDCGDGRSRVACSTDSGTAVFANIHIHAKVTVDGPSSKDPVWGKALRVANGHESPESSLDFRAVRQIGVRRLMRG